MIADIFNNVVVSLLGALALWIMGKTARYVRDQRTNSRFPVAGRYMSTYEDTVDGKLVVTKAVAVLCQKGELVEGETRPLDSDRVWELSARLSRNGRLVGSYTARDPHDTGLGAFFLEFRGSGYLEGIWSGFDSVNKRAEAGKYVFRRIPEVKVVALTVDVVPQVLSVLGNALGELYITKEELESYAKDSGDGDRFAYVIYNDNFLVGAATADYFKNSEEFFNLVPDDQISTLKSLLPQLVYNRIVLVHSVAVDPQYRHKGNATALIRAILEHGVRCGATNALAIGWTDQDGCHIQGTLEALGFESVADIDNYWHEDSVSKGYSCPSCGNPCTCTARIFSARSTTSIKVACRTYI